MRKILLALSLLLISNVSFSDSIMSQKSMEKIVKDLAINAEGGGGIVKFHFNKVKMYLISDIKHDRMRIIAPIVEYKKLSIENVDAVLESNFHKSLDARYAVSDGVLYSAYIHPLSELSENQIKSAVHQVSNLALSFGKEYYSGVLSYSKNKRR